MIGKFAWLSVVSLLVSACGDHSGHTDSASNAQSAAASAAHAVAAQGDGSEKRPTPVPPRPGQVLEAIYQKDAHGEDTMEIANGSQAAYWYGHAFDLNGNHYFTGFAYDTPNKYAEQEKAAAPAPDARVTITEATFEWTTDGGVAGWNMVGSERSIGEFGGYEKADTIDDKEPAVSMTTPNGQIVLAVPTWYLASGTRIKSFSMFVYQRTNASSNPDDTDWTYAGNVFRGNDNGAACDVDGTGNHVPCVTGSSTLTFLPAVGRDWPRLRVAMKGTGIDNVGQKKTYGAADVVEYRFNPKTKVYEAAKT
ncbi:hypothetical protein [Burkholderia lata]|uniref:Lipoprotein n=1 Tax=Burkholderia lata (strain ATCC 17760 / DSM 23089 / LMG 22485 / NCIMB 9086 / R18194 / 383) TaxID=482957 RepID=A0A6P2GS94_BURL3|nr:hypothetical protein [Burkholderia lata]VWB07336.1 hypothetical protein BLA15945_00155 [Burkholderia lata]VWB21187.1 hypothetical protein BLA15816_00842 [Burkholderia lata]